MSRRRLAANIPVLDRRISLGCHHEHVGVHTVNDTPPFPRTEVLTPITPIGQVMHTPLQPPRLERRESSMPAETSLAWTVACSPDTPIWTTLDVSLIPSPLFTPDSVIQVVKRLSLAMPSNSQAMHIPRRLSYSSRGRASPASPVDMRFVPTRGLLASPLCIRPSWSGTPQEVFSVSIESPRVC
ncbi:hypothetical protein FISHEDRAFT_71365 [Fistulina hepatica ATCC 64428]|nr:hypothetical protein FISHEDRAFT_71365 [Fistulina hepatica ATCC 64428]